MRTIDAVEYFGSKAKVAAALGFTKASANRWGYWLPPEVAQRLSNTVTTDTPAKRRLDTARAVFKEASTQLEALEKEVKAELEKKDELASKALNFDVKFYNHPEPEEINGKLYTPATDIKSTTIFGIRLDRGEVFYFYDHDNMQSTVDLTKETSMAFFRLYPIYRKGGAK